MRMHNYVVLFAFIVMSLLETSLLAGTKNLLVNGGFDSTNPPLAGWKYNYEDTGNEHWAANHLYVSLTNIPGAEKYALDLCANKGLLWGGHKPLILGVGEGAGQGVMVDSDPVPIEPKGKYRFSASARSTGCNARILVEGYRWRPGIKPHSNPKLAELRKCYRFPVLKFRVLPPEEKEGNMSYVDESWKSASQTFPDSNLTPLAKESFDKIQFLVVHIIAIDLYNAHVPEDKFFHLYVDDVVLERLN